MMKKPIEIMQLSIHKVSEVQYLSIYRDENHIALYIAWRDNPNRAARLRAMFRAWMVKTEPEASLVDVYTVNMMEIESSGDRALDHLEADNLLCELLRELGYGAVVDEYEKIDKWYA